MSNIDYTKICFVVMPFGKKSVGRCRIDFDRIYDQIFAPAIENTTLPEGGYLIPKRTDKDFYSAQIDIEMFQSIEYSRLTLVDITGLNPNVFYELGVRHHAHPTGTPIFRQTNTAIPFDITHIKAFPYEYRPANQISISREMVTRVLTESLTHNRLDSPVQIALAAQRRLGLNIDLFLKDAENAIRHQNWPLAISKYNEAIEIDPTNHTLYLEVGVLYKRQGNWSEAENNFAKAARLFPDYGDAQRELGIAQNKIYHQNRNNETLLTGEIALRKAIELNSQDFDAFASLGGILKRQGLIDDAIVNYNKALEISRGHSYPLLNVIKLQTFLHNEFVLTQEQEFLLKKAEKNRKAQALNNPPFDTPWCFFDLSDINLYLGNEDGFISYLNEGLFSCKDTWEAQTHLDSLMLTINAFRHLSSMEKAVRLINDTIPYLR